ncbi:MAG: hypothetical protein H7070_04085 [Saprospiraceae bacterium]|nr:hypothetical protein [Pyrinomonadaceae bacterium]
MFWQKASYNKTAEYLFVPGDEPPEITINKTVTDDGIQMDAAVENTKTIGDVTITQGASGDTRAIMVAGGNVGTEYKGIEYVEAVNNKERKSIRTETTVGWRSMTASCPDADGISAGTGTARIAIKMTITTPQTIGIVQREITVRMTLKGFVNDAAELTHFDMKGVAAEINSGYERARRLGLIQDSEFTDGTKQVDYEVGNNKLGSPVVNEYGFTRTVGEEMGEVKGTFRGDITQAEAQRIDKIAYRHIKWLCEQAAMYYKAARSNWRYGECVEIAFTAPKMKLAPAEKVDVTAETVHIYDKNKVNAELTLKAATDSATPEKESGTPKGKFNLTAPAKGSNAMIMLETVSRRGIALDSLDFEEEKPQKKPVPPKKKPRVKQCEGGWTGKITAVKSKRTETVKPASGRLVRQIENREETFSVDYYVLGIADTTQGFRNAYFSDAQMNYRAAEYRESNYAPGKMGCGDQIITTPQTQKFESLLTGLSGKRITVYVSSAGEKGILTFDSPEINAERIITRTYESSCPSYNAKNSSVDRSGALIGVPSPGFEIEFELDDKSGYVLEGSKTIENGDGSKTVVTWNLSRCK